MCLIDLEDGARGVALAGCDAKVYIIDQLLKVRFMLSPSISTHNIHLFLLQLHFFFETDHVVCKIRSVSIPNHAHSLIVCAGHFAGLKFYYKQTVKEISKE